MQSVISVLDKAAVEVVPILREYHVEVCRALVLAAKYYTCTCRQDDEPTDEKHDSKGCMFSLFRRLWRYVIAGETKAPYHHSNFRFPDNIDFDRARILNEKIVELLTLFAGTSDRRKTIIFAFPLHRGEPLCSRIRYHWDIFSVRGYSDDEDGDYFIRDSILRYCMSKCGEGATHNSLPFAAGALQ